MYVTVVYCDVSALVTKVYHAWVSGVLGAYFQGLQGGVSGTIDGYNAVIVGHLVGVITIFCEVIVEDMHIATLARSRFKGEGIGRRKPWKMRNVHPFVVFAFLNAKRNWSVDTRF